MHILQLYDGSEKPEDLVEEWNAWFYDEDNESLVCWHPKIKNIY